MNWKDLSLKDSNFVAFGGHPQVTSLSLGFPYLFKKALKEDNLSIIEYSNYGFVKNDLQDGKKYLDKFHSLNGRRVFESLTEDLVRKIFIWDNSILEFSYYFSNHNLSIHTLSTDQLFINKVKELFENEFLPAIISGHIFSIVHKGNKLDLASVGNAGVPLQRLNYMPHILKDYDYVVKDLQSPHPSGRLSIFEGSPGTGKSFMMKALLTEVPDALFILIPPDMIPNLSGPELLPLFLRQKEDEGYRGPIILILEDADRCLVSRQNDNIASIQALLNLGDGILGSMLDVRILATTNAKKLEMEPALLRPGRLSRRIEVGLLNIKAAQELFAHLVPNIPFPTRLSNNAKDISLAETYLLAREFGWLPEKREER